MTPLERSIEDDRLLYSLVKVEIDRDKHTAAITISGPDDQPPVDAEEAVTRGAGYWPLRLARELDDAILHLRVNELEIGTILIESEGDLEKVLTHDTFLISQSDHWFVREVLLYWSKLLRRVDLTSRTIITLVEPGSCFGGFLADLVLAADRSYMLEGERFDGDGGIAVLAFTDANRFGLPMSNGLSRLETRFWGDTEGLKGAQAAIGQELDAEGALRAGLITDALDDIDWDDELRMILEERSAFSPDGLIGMEANLRFPGPETMETKIFGRLTAWQNWVFVRPNASGEAGTLKRYGTGRRPEYDTRRV